MTAFTRRLWSEDEGRNIAEYTVILAVIVVVIVSTVRLLGSR